MLTIEQACPVINSIHMDDGVAHAGKWKDENYIFVHFTCLRKIIFISPSDYRQFSYSTPDFFDELVEKGDIVVLGKAKLNIVARVDK